MNLKKIKNALWCSISLTIILLGFAGAVRSEPLNFVFESEFIPQKSYIVLKDPIEILSNEDWQSLEKDNAWCSGDGTDKNPYIISNISINALNLMKSCIYIENTDVYFKIQNSKFQYATRGNGSFSIAGITLISISNGVVINNNMSYNFHGVYMSHCLDSRIEKNTMLNQMNISTGKAIFLDNGFRNYIGENEFTNHYDGICAWQSVNNTVNGNYIENLIHDSVGETGLFFSNCNNTMISNNTLVGKKGLETGLEDIGGKDNVFMENTGFTTNAKKKGISLQNSNNNIVRGNAVITYGDSILRIAYEIIFLTLAFGLTSAVIFTAFTKKEKMNFIRVL